MREVFSAEDGLTPHVGRVSLLGFHLLDVLDGFTLAHAALGLQHLEQNVPHVGGHVLGVTANVEMTLVLPYHIPQQIHVLLQQVRDVDFVRLIPGEGRPQLHYAALDVVFQFLFIDVILRSFPTAKVQNGLSHFLSVLLVEVALLDESTERSQTRTGTNHDDRSLRFGRQPELAFADEDRYPRKGLPIQWVLL